MSSISEYIRLWMKEQIKKILTSYVFWAFVIGWIIGKYA